MMKKHLLYFSKPSVLPYFYLLGLLLFSLESKAQVNAEHYLHFAGAESDLSAHFSCGYEDGQEILVEKGFNFATNQEAIQVVNDIMNAVGLKANFKVQGAKVQNAAAVVIKEDRYILYSPAFMKSVNLGSKTNWGAISIVAHEIGHHLQGHTLQKGGSRPKTELEADEFSGFVLRRLGASLEESQAAMRVLASPYGSMTHPARADRLASIAKGWKNADGMMGGTPEIVTSPIEPKEEVAESVTEEEETTEETPVAENKPTAKPNRKPTRKPSKVHPSYAQWQVLLEKNPAGTYYITSSNQFVVIKGKKIYVVGQIKRTGDDKYPYVIDMEKSSDLFISLRGMLFTRQGKPVGRVAKV